MRGSGVLQTSFLRNPPRAEVIERLQKAEREEDHPARHLLMVLMPLSFSTLCYAAVLLPEFFARASPGAGVLGDVGSLISLRFPVFLVLVSTDVAPCTKNAAVSSSRMETRLGKQN
jgi:hypothetical protein